MERKRAQEQAATDSAKRTFLRGMQQPAVGSEEPADEHGERHESSSCGSQETILALFWRTVADGDGRCGAGGADSSGSRAEGRPEDDAEQTERQAERLEARPADVEAKLDDEDQGADGVTSVMGAYLKAVFERLHSETIGEASRSALEAKWLLDMLNEEGANFWLPAARARSVCAKLGLEYGEPAYYRDIKVCGCLTSNGVSRSYLRNTMISSGIGNIEIRHIVSHIMIFFNNARFCRSQTQRRRGRRVQALPDANVYRRLYASTVERR